MSRRRLGIENGDVNLTGGASSNDFPTRGLNRVRAGWLVMLAAAATGSVVTLLLAPARSRATVPSPVPLGVADHLPIGYPITVSPGKGIIVGEAGYREKGDWAQVLVLDRRTLKTVKSLSFTKRENPQNLARAVGKDVTARHLVIVNGGGHAGNVSRYQWDQLKFIYRRLGGLTDQSNDMSRMDPAFKTGGWSLIGVPGMAPGHATGSSRVASTASSTAGSLSGHLQLDIHQNFTFVFGDYVPLDTNVPGQGAGVNVIRIGSETYSSVSPRTGLPPPPLSPGQSGFHVLVLDQGTLSFVGERTFVVSSQSGEDGMNGFLFNLLEPAFQLPRPLLVVIQSINAPHPQRSAWFKYLTPRIQALGGTAEVFNRLDGKRGYTLVGGTNIGGAGAETSRPLTAVAARLVGVLARDRQDQYVATESSPLGSAGLSLMPLAYQKPTPWPAWTSGQLAASRYIAGQLHLPDTSNIRAAYVSVDFQKSALLYALGILNSTGGTGFTADDFLAAKRELTTEFEWVVNVQGLIAQIKDLVVQAALTGSNSLENVAKRIQSDVGAAPNSQALAQTLGIMSQLLRAASGFAGEAGPAVGVVAAGFGIASAFATTSDGSPALGPIEARASGLGVQVADAYRQALGSLDLLSDILVSDYGKLEIAGENAVGPWALGSSAAKNTVTNGLQSSVARFFYGALVPAAYKVYDVQPGRFNPNPVNAPKYNCSVNNPHDSSSIDHHPFQDEPAAGWISVPEGFNDHGQPITRARALSTNLNFTNGDHTQLRNKDGHTPPSWLTDLLFNPNNAHWAGFDQASFFARSFQQVVVHC